MNQRILDEKKVLVETIADKIKNASSSVLVEYRGLSVAEVTELRRALRKEDVEFKVYKNSMVQRAVDSLGYNELEKDLVGPNAIAFSADATAPCRILADFSKKHPSLVLKSGIVEGKVVDAATISELSKLPNKDGMLSMLLSCLQSPVRSFACVVKAVADAKEGNTNE